MIPAFILLIWLLSLLSLLLVGGAGYVIHRWYEQSWQWNATAGESFFAPTIGANEPTYYLIAGILIGTLVLAGRPLLKWILKLLSPSSEGIDPRINPVPRESRVITGVDGAELYVEFFGLAKAPPIVCTHGWGLNRHAWNTLIAELKSDFNVIVWDLPGLGKSSRPSNRDYALEKLAANLKCVLELTAGQPAVLLGHSIGGMITQTFCRLYPPTLGTTVSGLVLTHTTHTNPVRTTSGAGFLTVIEKPILISLMYLTIVLSPFLWLMNLLSYLNGSSHLMNKFSSFAGTENWQQLEFATRFQLQASPAVLARGMLAMLRYNETDHLPKVDVPSLVVAGNKDSTTKPSASETIRSLIPHARECLLSPAKHLGFIEHHQAYAKAVREFSFAAMKRNYCTSAPVGEI